MLKTATMQRPNAIVDALLHRRTRASNSRYVIVKFAVGEFRYAIRVALEILYSMLQKLDSGFADLNSLKTHSL